jgi:hypothetical protein
MVSYHIRQEESLIPAPANNGTTSRVVRGTKATRKGVVRVVVTQASVSVRVRSGNIFVNSGREQRSGGHIFDFRIKASPRLSGDTDGRW